MSLISLNFGPKAAEANTPLGKKSMASKSEAYYSIDYGNVHIICLESEDLYNDATMLAWAQADLRAAKNAGAAWLIGMWHHPPYSKGSHDTDIEDQFTYIRNNFLTMIEDFGVDLVLCGHSHVYERSFLIDSHYGKSYTFNKDTMVKQGGSGNPGGSTGIGADENGRSSQLNGMSGYTKPLGIQPHAGAVYVVAGSSGGQSTGGTLNHPAMFMSRNTHGNLAVEIFNNTLDAYFVDTNGAVLDRFRISKKKTISLTQGPQLWTLNIYLFILVVKLKHLCACCVFLG